MRLKHTIQIEIARDELMKRKLFSDDPQLAQVVIDTFQRQTNSHLSIAPSTIESLPLGDIDAVYGLYLETDADCLVRFDGSVDWIQMKANDGVAKLFVEASIATIEVHNTDATETLSGLYCAWGDPTP